jgi:hypothetical protein
MSARAGMGMHRLAGQYVAAAGLSSQRSLAGQIETLLLA